MGGDRVVVVVVTKVKVKGQRSGHLIRRSLGVQ